MNKLLSGLKLIIVMQLFISLTGCTSVKTMINTYYHDNFKFKKKEMDDALKICWYISKEYSYKGEFYSAVKGLYGEKEFFFAQEVFWQKYHKKKINSNEIWYRYSQEHIIPFWRSELCKNIYTTIGIITAIPTFGLFSELFFFPDANKDLEYSSSSVFYENFCSKPSYKKAIFYCDTQYEKYIKTMQEYKNKELYI
jgi:hypothetical protein